MFRKNNLLLILVLGLAGACANTDDFAEDGGVLLPDSVIADLTLDDLQSLRIDPADYTLRVKSGSKTTLTYRAWGKFTDGSERDITSKVEFQLSTARVGNFSENIFYPAISWGGGTTVYASTDTGMKATTSLKVVFDRAYKGPGIPNTVESDFTKGAANKGIPLQLAYPPDGTLMPPNLMELEVQWLPGSGQKYFQISFTNDGTDIRIYTTCAVKIGTNGCGYTPSDTEWKAIVGALKGYEPAKIMVRGADTAFSSVGESNVRTMSVAEEDIMGGLYYWNATPGNIIRYDFGKANQKAKLFYTRTDAKALFCVGCHALSLDGSRMAVGMDMPAPAPLQVLDVSNRTVLSKGAANFMAFSPDGKLMIASDGNSMSLHDSDTLKVIKKPLRAKGTMPDWSPDSKFVVYAEPKTSLPIPVGSPGITQGSLKLMGYDIKTTAWSATSLTLVASAGENNYYPTFSPDAKWVAFNRASGSSYDAPDAALWIVRADGKGKAQELKLANKTSNMCNSWPKFSPFLQKYKGGKLMWLTFSSRRDYGLRLKGTQQAQLWMTAIDPSKAELATTDPSYPAFWLPFQNIKTANHIAQWTKKLVKKPCGPDGSCPDGMVCDKTTKLCEPK